MGVDGVSLPQGCHPGSKRQASPRAGYLDDTISPLGAHPARQLDRVPDPCQSETRPPQRVEVVGGQVGGVSGGNTAAKATDSGARGRSPGMRASRSTSSPPGGLRMNRECLR